MDLLLLVWELHLTMLRDHVMCDAVAPAQASGMQSPQGVLGPSQSSYPAAYWPQGACVLQLQGRCSLH